MNLDQFYDWIENGWKPETWNCQTEGAQRYVEEMEWLQNLLILLLQLMSNADANIVLQSTDCKSTMPIL